MKTKTFTPKDRAARVRQDGVALATCLIFLTLMTLLGVSAMQDATLEEKMAGNFRDQNLAFQAAEMALRAAETRLREPVAPTFNCSAGFYRLNDVNCDGATETSKIWKGVDWASNQVVTLTNSAPAPLAAAPGYIVEQMDAESTSESMEGNTSGDTNIYRITTRGVGSTPTAVVQLQSTFIP